MKIIIPNWVKHEHKGVNLSIFSIDIHPDGTRFATGGQGNDCGRVAIWNMAAVISVDVENDKNQAKLLCQIDSHLQCVNCVRWSHGGHYLASAGDDKLIMIWTLGGRYQGQTEHYRTVATLRSHNGDILDLSWSYDDQYLASCSVDNMIVIWNAQRWPEITKILDGHSGMVKGVAWDPIGKYLASQSADKTLRIWRISDWVEETTIKEPFQQCSDTTHVLRISWSPDGQYLISAQAMNNCGSVAKIIQRQDWSYHQDLVGHRKAISCSRFNPNIFKCTVASKKEEKKSKAANGTNDQQPFITRSHFIGTLGSRDRSISVWATSRQRPLVVMDDVFVNSVVDQCWSRGGYHLLACSVDGGVACFEFEEKELGKIYTEEERMQHLQKLYGASTFSSKSQNSLYNRLIEDMDILNMMQQKKKPAVVTSSSGSQIENKHNQNGLPPSSAESSDKTTGPTINHRNSGGTPTNKSAVSPSSSSSSAHQVSPGRLAKGPTDKQIEIRSADGRRRIIPLFIPPTDNGTDAKNTTGNTGSANTETTAARLPPPPITFSSSSESKSKIVIQTVDESNPESKNHVYQHYYSNHSCDSLPANGSTTAVGDDKKSHTQDGTISLVTGKNSGDGGVMAQSQTNPPQQSDNNKKLEPPSNGTVKRRSSDDDPSGRGSSESSSSSDGEVIIKRTKKSSPSSSSKAVNAPAAVVQPIQIKRKPGRPPGTGIQPQPPQQQQQQQPQKYNHSLVVEQPKSLKAMEKPQTSLIKQPTSSTSGHLVNGTLAAGSTHQRHPSTSSSPGRCISFPPLKLPRTNHSGVRLFNRPHEGKMFSASIEYPIPSSGICKLTLMSMTSEAGAVSDKPQLPEPCWSTMMSAPILAVAANEEILACFCDDFSINVFHAQNGRRLYVPIILPCLVARMICANKSHLLLITCHAELWLWDFLVPKVLVAGISLAPILIDPRSSQQLSIQSASVSSTSKPIVAISNGRTYVYETELSCWCLLDDLNDPLNSSVDLKRCAIGDSVKGLGSFTKLPSRSLLNFFSSNAAMCQQSSLSFVEKQIQVAKMLGSVTEYRFWLLTLVQQLVSVHSAGQNLENIECRLKEICTELLTRDSCPKAIGMTGLDKVNKRELLQDVLATMGSNLGLQRLYLEYKDLMEYKWPNYRYKPPPVPPSEKSNQPMELEPPQPPPPPPQLPSGENSEAAAT